MPIMKNKDLLKEENYKIVQKLSQAMQDEVIDRTSQEL